MVAPIVLAAGIGAGMGLLQGKQKREAEARQRALAAQTALYSPWTHMTPQMPGDTNISDSVLQGALGGASFGLANIEQLGAMMGPDKSAPPVTNAINPVENNAVPVGPQSMDMYANAPQISPQQPQAAKSYWDWQILRDQMRPQQGRGVV